MSHQLPALTIPAPMQAPARNYKPFISADWLYEIKFDGYRLMAGIQAGRVELRTRGGHDWTARFPEVVQALAKLPGGPHVIDGEACVLVDLGRSDFNRMHARTAARSAKDPVTFIAFDLLVHDGQTITELPLDIRKARLVKLLAGAPKRVVLYVGELDAETYWTAVVGLNLEGVVAKRRASPYLPGVRSDDWRKIKRPGWQERRLWRK